MKEKIHVLYLRSGREPYGVLVMRQNGVLGVSVCHRPLDSFIRERGVRIAYGRACKGRGLNEQLKRHRKEREILAEGMRLRRKFVDNQLTPDFFNYEIETDAAKAQAPTA